MTSYITDGTVGPWAKEKLKYLGKYLNAYTTILKNQSWCDSYIYIDAFAGGGKAPLRQYNKQCSQGDLLLDVANYINEEEGQAEFYIEGSPRVALDIKYPFTEYVFVENNVSRIDKLRELSDEYGGKRNITILEGDANEQIRNYILSENRYDWKRCRGVAFLDPFGMQVPWQTIEAIGETRAVELILNLPVGMAIQRLLPNSGIFRHDEKEKLTIYFGSPGWEEIVYEKKKDLFGEQTTKISKSGEQLAKWYQKRLKVAYGYASNPRLIKNTKGTHLYYLLWAGPNATGSKIASDVLKQGEIV